MTVDELREALSMYDGNLPVTFASERRGSVGVVGVRVASNAKEWGPTNPPQEWDDFVVVESLPTALELVGRSMAAGDSS